MSTLEVPISVGNVFEPLLTSQQAAELMHIHPKTLERMARSGRVTDKQVLIWVPRAARST